MLKENFEKFFEEIKTECQSTSIEYMPTKDRKYVNNWQKAPKGSESRLTPNKTIHLPEDIREADSLGWYYPNVLFVCLSPRCKQISDKLLYNARKTFFETRKLSSLHR